MDKLALLVLLDARPGKETAVEEFLKSAQPLVLQEAGRQTGMPAEWGPGRSQSSTRLSTKMVATLT